MKWTWTQQHGSGLESECHHGQTLDAAAGWATARLGVHFIVNPLYMKTVVQTYWVNMCDKFKSSWTLESDLLSFNFLPNSVPPSFLSFNSNLITPALSFLPFEPPHRWRPSCAAPLCRSWCCCQSPSFGPRSSCWCSASLSCYLTWSHSPHLATVCGGHGNKKTRKRRKGSWAWLPERTQTRKFTFHRRNKQRA